MLHVQNYLDTNNIIAGNQITHPSKQANGVCFTLNSWTLYSLGVLSYQNIICCTWKMILKKFPKVYDIIWKTYFWCVSSNQYS